MTKLVKQSPEYALEKVGVMAMYCTFTNRFFVTKQNVLANAYLTLFKNYDEYRDKVIKLYGKKKPWPRRKSKRFHKMRVGA